MTTSIFGTPNTRRNAVKVGPHKDIGPVGKAVQQGLRFGVSEHLWISYKWFAVNHGSDMTGPMAGVPYDGVLTAYSDLYHDSGCTRWAHDSEGNAKQFAHAFGWEDDGVPETWKHQWYLRMRDLIDNYQPDLLYTDGPLPFEDYGSSVVANLYNQSAKRHGGSFRPCIQASGRKTRKSAPAYLISNADRPVRFGPGHGRLTHASECGTTIARFMSNTSTNSKERHRSAGRRREPEWKSAA